MAVLEANRASTDPFTAHDLGHYVEEFGEPFVFRSNGENAQFWAPDSDSRTGGTTGFSAQGDLRSSITAPWRGAPTLWAASRRAWTREPVRLAAFAPVCQPGDAPVDPRVSER